MKCVLAQYADEQGLEMYKIMVGDRVQLNGRGHVMTVNAFLDRFGHAVERADRCKCTWIGKTEVKAAEFSVRDLEKVGL